MIVLVRLRIRWEVWKILARTAARMAKTTHRWAMDAEQRRNGAHCAYLAARTQAMLANRRS